MYNSFLNFLSNELTSVKEAGLYKAERVITSPQRAEISVSSGAHVTNFCANNYLGLGAKPELIEAAKAALDTYGYGLASVRFICGTQTVHKDLEGALSKFLQTEDTILYGSCFDANGGLFETILGPEDAVISDSLNHASIIDGVRLCKAKRFRYANNDMKDLEAKLIEAKDARFRLIATDGVFSMDGIIANLAAVCELADKYDASVMVDDSHAVGFMGETGRGTPEYCGVSERVDIVTGTLGKALGGASGGYTSGRKPIIDWLRQRSRPYLFSNTLAPAIAGASLKVLELLSSSGDLREKLFANTRQFRQGISERGFTIIDSEHPIVPVMIGNAAKASEMADALLEQGIYVVGFSFPVVPKDQARIRVQLSAAHDSEQIERALEAFTDVGKTLGVI